MENLDIIITSSSRYPPLRETLLSMQRYLRFSGKKRIHVNIDVPPNRDAEALMIEEFLEENVPEVCTKFVINPREGIGPGLNRLKRCAVSKYVWYTEDDWRILSPINVDRLVSLMENNSKVNQISFSKLNNPPTSPKPGGPDGQDVFTYEPRLFKEATLLVAERWRWAPSLWRTSFMKSKWNFALTTATKKFGRMLKQNAGLREWDPSWQEENIGAYIYGKIGAKTKIKHLADDDREPERQYI